MPESSSRRFYVGNRAEWEKISSGKNLLDKELRVKVIERGIVLPARPLSVPNPVEAFEGGVCDKDFNFVAGFSRTDADKIIRGGVYYGLALNRRIKSTEKKLLSSMKM